MKSTSKQPANVTLTAVAKPAPARPWPTQEKVKDLARMLDHMEADAEAMLKLTERLETAPNDLTRKAILRDAEKLIEHFEKTGGRSAFKSGRLKKLCDACQPDGWWDMDMGTPSYGEVSKMVGKLMGSFPTSKIPSPDVFVRVLMEDLMELNPDFPEMEVTCRQLRKTKTFMPSISEILEEFEKQQKLWHRRWDTYEIIREFYDDLWAMVAKAKGAQVAPATPVIEHRQAVPMAPIDTPDTVEVKNDADEDDEF